MFDGLVSALVRVSHDPQPDGDTIGPVEKSFQGFFLFAGSETRCERLVRHCWLERIARQHTSCVS